MKIKRLIYTSWEDFTGESYEAGELLLEIQRLHDETTMDNSTGNFSHRLKANPNFGSRDS